MTNQETIIKIINSKFKIYDNKQIENLVNDSLNPVVLTFESLLTKKPTSIPIWIILYKTKFYAFASKNSKKVKAIEGGNTEINLLIINKEFYPHPEEGLIPYLGIKGTAVISSYKENKMIPKIHQDLLKKYDENLSIDWVKELYHKLEKKPELTWLIEITPKSYYSY